MLDHLRSMDWAPRMLRSRVQRLQEMIRQIEMSEGRAPTDEQLSSALNMPVDEVQNLKGEVLPPPVRIRTTQDQEHGHSVNLDLLPQIRGESPVNGAQRADLKEFLLRPFEKSVKAACVDSL